MPVIMAGSMLVLHLVGRGTGRDWEMCVCVAMCVWTEDQGIWQGSDNSQGGTLTDPSDPTATATPPTTSDSPLQRSNRNRGLCIFTAAACGSAIGSGRSSAKSSHRRIALGPPTRRVAVPFGQSTSGGDAVQCATLGPVQATQRPQRMVPPWWRSAFHDVLAGQWSRLATVGKCGPGCFQGRLG
ncbi:hypothetical protein B0J13DRAFT_633568 [Dactylonectria estremocensis]|uniref:Secreted protein n=1 Tax=Dactylonectria estremocensis TaxID=1079267 RepID=A0A9P9JKV3_9HYPO|nr:hypothetical protein B0J13DRAFT_633568 [Dactylonectria estremocensis]